MGFLSLAALELILRRKSNLLPCILAFLTATSHGPGSKDFHPTLEADREEADRLTAGLSVGMVLTSESRKTETFDRLIRTATLIGNS